jgi:hypothetical protein
LLLTFGHQPLPRPSQLTTSVSAWVAPYLKRASGYIRPDFRAAITRDRSRILTIAQKYNDRTQTNMSDTQFATVMVTILYNEHNGWLEDAFPAMRPLTPFYQEAQAVSNALLGTNFSVWPANVRPSVVREILTHHVPEVGIVPLAIDAPPDDAIPVLSQHIANTPDTAYELLGANLRRGVYRAQKENVVVTWQTLLAWHNAGIVHPQDIAQNASLQHYLSRAVPYIATAQTLYRSVGICQNDSPRENSSAHALQVRLPKK